MHGSRFVIPTADLLACLIASSYIGAVVYLAGASWDRALLQGLESAGIEGRPVAMLLAAAMMIGLGIAIRELARTGQQPIARALSRPRIVLVALGVAAIAVLPELGPWWRSHLPDEHAASVMPALLGLAGLSAVLASLLQTACRPSEGS